MFILAPYWPLWAPQWRMPADSMKKIVNHQQGNQSILHKLEKWRTRPEHFRAPFLHGNEFALNISGVTFLHGNEFVSQKCDMIPRSIR